MGVMSNKDLDYLHVSRKSYFITIVLLILCIIASLVYLHMTQEKIENLDKKVRYLQVDVDSIKQEL